MGLLTNVNIIGIGTQIGTLLNPISYFANYVFTASGVSATQLLDQSGNDRHITLVGGINDNFLYGFAETLDGTKYTKSQVDDSYIGLDYSEQYDEFPPFHINSGQFFSAPIGDADFIAKDADNRFYDEDGNPREFSWQDVSELPTSYLTITISDSGVLQTAIIAL